MEKVSADAPTVPPMPKRTDKIERSGSIGKGQGRCWGMGPRSSIVLSLPGFYVIRWEQTTRWYITHVGRGLLPAL